MPAYAKEILVNINMQKTNTIIYICNYCTLQNIKPMKHLYIFPDIGTNDYEHFYMCPLKEPAKSFPTKYKTLLCPSCNAVNNNVQTHGYQWLCNSCHTERLITPSLNADIYAHTGLVIIFAVELHDNALNIEKTIDLLQ